MKPVNSPEIDSGIRTRLTPAKHLKPPEEGARDTQKDPESILSHLAAPYSNEDPQAKEIVSKIIKSSHGSIPALEKEFEKVTILEITQCGDVFLMQVLCPKCNETNLLAYPLEECPNCYYDLNEIEPILPHPSKRKVLVGSYRKTRAGLTKKKIKIIYEEQERLCFYCMDNLGQDYHVEHIHPLFTGGTNDLDNIVLSCARCNFVAGKKWFHTAQAKQRYILARRAKLEK